MEIADYASVGLFKGELQIAKSPEFGVHASTVMGFVAGHF
tara:strand:- start:44 stop:163 length:120 start_codon:yes stop_codon:yes gene_type:complete